METRFTYLLVAMATMAAVCCAVAVPANARADASASTPADLAELLQWHSGATVTGESCVNPEWKSALIAIDPEESMASRVWHGTDGAPAAAKGGFDSSAASFNFPKADLKSARDPAGAR